MKAEDIEKTLTERGSRYGEFPGHASVTQALKDAFYHHTRADGATVAHILTPAMREAADMIFHKLGRIANGDPFYVDSWHDIVGYAKLAEDSIVRTQVPKIVPDTDEDVRAKEYEDLKREVEEYRKSSISLRREITRLQSVDMGKLVPSPTSFGEILQGNPTDLAANYRRDV